MVTWSYSMELDPVDGLAGAATNDDTKLTVSTPMGTFGVFVLEGGLDLKMVHLNQFTQDQLILVTLQQHKITLLSTIQ